MCVGVLSVCMYVCLCPQCMQCLGDQKVSEPLGLNEPLDHSTILQVETHWTRGKDHCARLLLLLVYGYFRVDFILGRITPQRA